MNIAIQDEIDTDTSQLKISSRRRRLCAYLIDYVLLTLCMHIFSSILPIFSNKHTYGFSTISIVSYICYFSIFPLSIWWATPGQRLLGIYICTTKDQKQISGLRSFCRIITFHLLWILSLAVSAYIFIGQDIKHLESVFRKGAQHKKSIHFQGNMFYKDNPHYISFRNEKNNQKIYLLNVIGQSNIIIENREHQLSLSSNGKEIATEYYDETISPNTQLQTVKSLVVPDKYYKTEDKEIEGIFFIFIKIIGYSIAIFLALLIFPTMFNRRKQTIYDLIYGVFVAKGIK